MTQRHAIIAAIAGFFVIGAMTGTANGAEVIISINKAAQTMLVLVDGVATHTWPVSTGLGGGPPSSTYRPQRMERKWFSRKYNWSPMPHSIFFHEGYAIHGTIYVSRLGHRASHGCVRLHPKNAATLFDLVRQNGMANARIVVSNTSHVTPSVAPASAANPSAPNATTLPAAYVEPAGQIAPAPTQPEPAAPPSR